jgi:hypothetical protein
MLMIHVWIHPIAAMIAVDSHPFSTIKCHDVRSPVRWNSFGLNFWLFDELLELVDTALPFAHNPWCFEQHEVSVWQQKLPSLH